jgi:putative FmdB family regulatory protein
MPTYDYHCDTCGKDFEWFQPITAPKLTICPEQVCTSATKAAGQVHRKISGGTGIIFNGDGFYLTDYVKNTNNKSLSTSAPRNGSSEGTSENGSASSNGASSAASSAHAESASSSSSNVSSADNKHP